MGLPRKANYSGRWDVLIEKCTKCLQRLMDIGCHRRRNYILDQVSLLYFLFTILVMVPFTASTLDILT